MLPVFLGVFMYSELLVLPFFSKCLSLLPKRTSILLSSYLAMYLEDIDPSAREKSDQSKQCNPLVSQPIRK